MSFVGDRPQSARKRDDDWERQRTVVLPLPVPPITLSDQADWQIVPDEKQEVRLGSRDVSNGSEQREPNKTTYAMVTSGTFISYGERVSFISSIRSLIEHYHREYCCTLSRRLRWHPCRYRLWANVRVRQRRVFLRRLPFFFSELPFQ